MIVLFIVVLWVALLAYFKVSRRLARMFYTTLTVGVLSAVHGAVCLVALIKWPKMLLFWILLIVAYGIVTAVIVIREIANAGKMFAKSNLQVGGKLIETQGRVGTVVGSAVGGPVGTVVGSVGGAGLQAIGRAYTDAGDKIITYDQTAYDRLRNKAIENGINVDGLDIEGIAQKVISCASKAGVYEITQANPGITAVDLATQLICANRS